MPEPPTAPLDVVVVGAGVAGLECAMALHALAGPRVAITIVAPTTEFVYRPMSVAEAFGIESPRPCPVAEIAADLGATFVQDEMAWIAVRSRRIFLRSGDELGYDALVIALGAHATPPWPEVPSFRGPSDVSMVREMVDEIERGDVASLALVVPSGMTWPFPLYEIALLMAHRAREAGSKTELTLFTPETEPLGVFGREASAEVRDLLARAGVRFKGGLSVEADPGGGVLVRGQDEPRRFDRVLTLPRLEGPAPRGLPCDDDGFIPVDSHGMVLHVEHVYAAGDGTNFPVKQGGIASQQADAVAEMIAKRSGARVDPRPLRPILRAHLLANGASRYLRGELHHRDGGVSEASENAMWWPASKIAGTYLAPYLAQHSS